MKIKEQLTLNNFPVVISNRLPVKKIENEKYFYIAISGDIEVGKNKIQELLNLKLINSDAFFSIVNNLLVFYFNKVDINNLKVALKNLELPDLLEYLYLRINSVRSYGINNGARVYLTYNDELKVQHKADKSKKRKGIFYSKPFSHDENIVPDKFVDKIFTADSELFLKELPDNSIDLIFTSPPYNFGIEYSDHDDSMVWQDYFAKLYRILFECIRIMKFGARLVVNIQPLFSEYIPSHHFISNYLTSQGLIHRNEIIWEKNNYSAKFTSWGSWKSPSSPYFKYTWEFIEVFSKGSIKKSGETDKSDLTAEEFKKWTIGKWNIAPERNMKKLDHDAIFPEELAKRVIKLFSFKGDLVLDPFNGVGTTTKVAKDLGRRFIGIDASEVYNETAIKRMEGVI